MPNLAVVDNDALAALALVALVVGASAILGGLFSAIVNPAHETAGSLALAGVGAVLFLFGLVGLFW